MPTYKIIPDKSGLNMAVGLLMKRTKPFQLTINKADKELPPLVSITKPLSFRKLKSLSSNGTKQITVRVPVSFRDLTQNMGLYDSYESFLDTISERITGSVAGLTNFSYEPVALKGDAIILEVTGDVSEFLDEQEEEIISKL